MYLSCKEEIGDFLNEDDTDHRDLDSYLNLHQLLRPDRPLNVETPWSLILPRLTPKRIEYILEWNLDNHSI